jgi:hypothetical protein
MTGSDGVKVRFPKTIFSEKTTYSILKNQVIPLFNILIIEKIVNK